jgi:hypothetical protein
MSIDFSLLIDLINSEIIIEQILGWLIAAFLLVWAYTLFMMPFYVYQIMKHLKKLNEYEEKKIYYRIRK